MNDHTKKKIAPIVVTVLFVGYLLIYVFSLLFVSQFQPHFLLLAIPLIALGIAMIVVLRERIKEINGGEEDDLSNY